MSLFTYTPGELSLSLNPDTQPDIYIPTHNDNSSAITRRNRKRKHTQTAQEIEEADSDATSAATRADSEMYDEDDKEDDTHTTDKKHLRKQRRLQEDLQSLPVPRRHPFLASTTSSINSTDVRLPRTLFVGNLSVQCTKKSLHALFSPFGPIESSRFRSFASMDPRLPKKAVMVRHAFHEQQPTMNAYIVYAEQESIAKACQAMNGQQVMGHIVRVNPADNSITTAADATTTATTTTSTTGAVALDPQHRHEYSVFLGNLPFNVADDDLHVLFAHCGPIICVRVIRDAQLNIGKGFGFVVFASTASVRKALLLNGTVVGERPIRVTKALNAEKMKQINQTRRKEAAAAVATTGAARRIGHKEKHAARRAAAAVAPDSSTLSKLPAYAGEVSNAAAYLAKQQRTHERHKQQKAERRKRKSLVKRTKK